MTSLVFDATALSHFARADRTDKLQMAVADDEPILLAEVAAELARGIPDHASLGSAAATDWLKKVELEELPELAAFARYKGELGGGPERNNGEAAVLAWVAVNGGIAIIDEVAARAIGNRERLQVHGSLWLPAALRACGTGGARRPAAYPAAAGGPATVPRLPGRRGGQAARVGILHRR